MNLENNIIYKKYLLLIELGFDFKKNSAYDLVESINYLIWEEKYEKKNAKKTRQKNL